MNEMEQKTVSVIGLGYIGLPTASLLATKGYKVNACDINKHVVDTINRGEVPLVEKGLDILVKSAVNSGFLKADTKPTPADIFIIAVPTPFKEDHLPDMSYVEAATKSIAPLLEKGNLVILESTSPVGTTDEIALQLKALRPDLSFPKVTQSSATKFPNVKPDPDQVYIAHCPERVLPGQILRELIDNDRIIGGINRVSAEKAKEFYATFVNGEIFTTNARVAELSKLTENAYRDVNIAFANELSLIAEKLNVNVWELIKLANRHPRVNILQPGPGVGGHCIAVDPWLIISSAPEEARLIKMARQVNDSKPQQVINRVKKQAERFKAPVIACLGLAFKENIDDLRESPALHIVETLAKENVGQLMAVEPNITELPKNISQYKNVFLTDIDNAMMEADIVLVLVSHSIFHQIESPALAEKVVIDTRGLWQ